MISLIICTYNPIIPYFKRTVEAIFAQNLDKSEWEFFVIDNNSSSPVSELDFIKQLGVRVITESKQGLTAARGSATRNAKGDILVFIDDDLIIEKNYLSLINKIFNDSNVGIVSGNISAEYEVAPEKWFSKFENMIAIRRYKGNQTLFVTEDYMYSDIFPIGAGMSIKKEIIQSYYNDHLTNGNYIEGRKGNDLSSAEDIDLDYYALSKGYKIGISPLLHSIHLIPKNRVTINYIAKLSVSSLKSTVLVNQKWAPVFKKNLFEIFNISYIKLIIGMIAHRMLSMNKVHYIRYLIYKDLLKYR